MKKKQSMDFSKKIIIGMVIIVLIMTIIDTIIFCFKGDYPEVMYTTLCGAVIAELIALWHLKIDKRKYESQNNQNEGENVE